MKKRCFISAFLFLIFFIVETSHAFDYPPAVLQAEATIPDTVDYNFHIKPILADRCYLCHGPDANTRVADLRLDKPDSAFGPLLFHQGSAIVPGKPEESFLLHKVLSDNEDERMPPKGIGKPLTPKEVALLKRWIEQGAEYKPHWAFIPLEPASWVNDPSRIDDFVQAKLNEQGLSSVGEADKEMLLRRVTFDLTGLPPSVEEIDAFLADNSPDAYEKVVDHLLASPQYGERMAVDWLDVSRYADTYGYQADFYRPSWHWRDWAIEAFQNNMPYDEFVEWQLAGDLLPHPTRDQILATGFNRNHAQNAEGGIVNEEYRVEYVTDRTNTFGRAFLGITLKCAHCHDHKYDPISQKDYYRIFSFFNNVDESGQITWSRIDMPAPTMLLPSQKEQGKLDVLNGRISQLEDRLEELRETQRSHFAYWLESCGSKGCENRGCVAHYSLDDLRNDWIPNTVGDATGHIIDTVTMKEENVTWKSVPGRNGNAVEVDGDAMLDFPNVGKFTAADPFTIALWIWVPEDLESGVIFHSNRGGIIYSFKGYQLSIEDNHFDVRLAHSFPYNAIHLVSADAVPKEEWIHVALTYSGSGNADGVHLYCNGKRLSMNVVRDRLYKDIVFHRESIGTNLRVGARWRSKGFTNGKLDEIAVYRRELAPYEVAALEGCDAPPDREQLFDSYLSNVNLKYRLASRDLQEARRERMILQDQMDEAMVMAEMPHPRQAYVLKRGSYSDHGEPVSPLTPKSILPFPESLPHNRLGLAKWLVHPKNPLTARVFVNRLWQMCFGRGIVKTAEDFGSQGSVPTHPQLLDWLASQLIASGWDIKATLKTIVMSKTYCRSSVASQEAIERDPENIWLSRGPSRRLSAEMLRDQALAASGLLVRKIGGPSVKPYQPEGLWSFSSDPNYTLDTGEKLYRRSMYTFWKRTVPPPAMNLFDAPARSYCVVRRQKTNTPLQALVLMNDPQFVEASRALAVRVLDRNEPTDKARIGYAFRMLTSRHPSERELNLLTKLYETERERFEKEPKAAQGWLTLGEYRVPETYGKLDAAALAVTVNTMMNSDASIRIR